MRFVVNEGNVTLLELCMGVVVMALSTFETSVIFVIDCGWSSFGTKAGIASIALKLVDAMIIATIDKEGSFKIIVMQSTNLKMIDRLGIRMNRHDLSVAKRMYYQSLLSLKDKNEITDRNGR